MMEEFHLESFVAKPTLRSLSLLKKLQLIDYYELSIVSSMKKGEIKKLITVHQIDEELVPEEETEESLSSSVNANSLELKCLEFQEWEKAREAQLKLKELEICEKELSIQLGLKELESPVPRQRSPSAASDSRPPTFDVSKHIKLVPPFQERKVDKYFLHFEKVATSLEWPKKTWMLLLQSVLVG